MKIIHVVEPFSSGIITFIIKLTSKLKQHEHVVVHGVRTTEDKIHAVRSRFNPNVQFKIWKHANRSVNPVKDTLALVSLIGLLSKEKYDVLHLHSAKAGFIGKIASWVLGRGNVLYTPNSAPFLRTDISSLQQSIFKRLEKVSATLIGKIVCCGKSEAEVYRKIGVRAIYINNGIEISGPPRLINIKPPLILACGAIITNQKKPSMFNAIATHFKNDRKINFKWIGDGALRAQIDERAVYVTGWLNAEQADKEIEGADIYFSTAQWEGQPFAVLEAMNKGKCLLLYDCPGNRDLVVAGVNGYLFKTVSEAIEKIEALLAKPDEILRMGQQSYEICKRHHNIEITAMKYEKQYVELASLK